MTLPRLDLFADPPGATDLVLIAHGGRQQSIDAPPSWGHALLRMLPFIAVATEAAPEAAVGLVRYRHRGWNLDADPLIDLRRVLDAAARRGISRAVLVGHSMGARAVVGVGDHPTVRGICALAPWLPGSEGVPDLGGRLVVLAHGLRDRITSPAMTASFAERARAQGVGLALFGVDGDSHALLRRAGDWEELARRVVTSSLSGPVDEAIASAISTVPDHGADLLPHWQRSRPGLATVMRIAGVRRRLRPVSSIAVD